MQRVLRYLIALGLLVCVPAYANLPSASVFGVRTTGADTNGGGYDSAGTGTDLWWGEFHHGSL